MARALSVEVTGITLVVCRTRRRDDPISCWSQAIVAMAGPAAEQRYVRYPAGALPWLKRTVWATDRRNAEHWWGQTAVAALPIIALEMIGLVFPRRRGS